MEIVLGIAGIIGGLFLLTVLVGAPYVPTHGKQFKQLLSYLKLDRQRDVLVDLGAGDGKTLRLAANHVKKAIGYEINPILLVVAKFLSRRLANIDLRLADFRSISLPEEVTIAYIFSAGTFETKIAKILQTHAVATQRPLKLISYGFAFKSLGEPEQIKFGFYIYQIQPKH